jgi:hypothetical protein
MSGGGDMRFGRWRRFIEEVLVGTSAVVLAFTAIDATAEAILAAVALVGIALLVELHVTAQPTGEPGLQPQRPPAESASARPEPQAVTGFDAPIVDATSV